jgi:hypothetical protein
MQSAEQKKDMEAVFSGVKGAGVLDFVTAWYILAAQYLKQNNTEEQKVKGTGTRVAFVSTNSISQGEQVGILWNELFNKYHIKIHFAHRTFKWGNEARGNAAVHVVIIGFSNFESSDKLIFHYENVNGKPTIFKSQNINSYLIDYKDLIILSRKQPICDVPQMQNGSMPNDEGNLIVKAEEKEQLIKNNPAISQYLKLFIGADEFLYNRPRYCFWLVGINPAELHSNKEILDRINKVRSFRLNSTRETTQLLASTPYLFGELRQPDNDYIIIPVTSSENRPYIPMSIFRKDIIVSNLCNIIPSGSLYLLGVLISKMSMIWVRNIGGRLESRLRFTKDNVYNNFPWPENPTDKQKEAVEQAAQKVLDTRELFPGTSLADLYNPTTMPPALVKAHQELDKLVDLCYRPQPFLNETKRIEYLFELYDKYTAGLFGKQKGGKNKKGIAG